MPNLPIYLRTDGLHHHSKQVVTWWSSLRARNIYQRTKQTGRSMSLYSQFIAKQWLSRAERIDQRAHQLRDSRGKNPPRYDHLPEAKPLSFLHPDRFFLFAEELQRRFDKATNLSRRSNLGPPT